MINLREKNFKLFKVAISTVFNNIKQTMIQVNFKKKKRNLIRGIETTKKNQFEILQLKSK